MSIRKIAQALKRSPSTI
ncbi:MAG: helix-turn-helix domain-containing protein, partial [Anaerococcus sp.]|nr:helix-turn-helix domain-containing protein [Anaerococcus sp.]